MSNVLYTPLTKAAFELSNVPKPKNPLTVNELARQLLPCKVTNKEIDTNLKKLYWLGNYTQKKKPKPVHGLKSKNQLKRILGLNHPPKSAFMYTDVLKLNELWKSYIKAIVNFDDLRKRGWDGTPGCKNWEALMSTLYKSDFHGAHIKVISSKCSSYNMVEGIILVDTKYTLQILGVDNILKTILKEHCIFEIEIERYRIHLYGKHFIIRSKDRSKKKIKDNLRIQIC